MTIIEYIKCRYKLIFWLIIFGAVMAYFSCTICRENIRWYLLMWSFCSSMWIFMWLGNEYLVDWLDTKLSWTEQPLSRLLVGVFAMIFYTVPAIWLLIELFDMLGIHINTRTETMWATMGVTFIITFFMTSRSFLYNWRQSAIDAQVLQKESIAAKYESLKNQVNPHFLFNSFNALTNLVYEDQDKAAKFIKQLSDVYRYVLDPRDKEVVSIEEELKFLHSYSYLQQIRFGSKLNIQIDVNNPKVRVAPLALQMLIENAIKHNITSEEDPLYVRVYLQNESIVVENNLQKKNRMPDYAKASSGKRDDSAGVGLENIVKRYEFLSNKKVEIIENEKMFIVKLPTLIVSE